MNVRGTQSFVATLSSCWQRPSLTLLEVAWRWSFGIPALMLVFVKLHGVLRAATAETMDPGRLGLDPVLLNDPVGALSADPMGAAGKFAHAIGLVLPGIEHIAVWLLPLLLIGWVVQSSVGRTIVLRRAEPGMHLRVGTLMMLQAIRLTALTAVWAVWFALLGWSSRAAVVEPIARHGEPNLVLYCGMVIVFSLVIYTAWALVNWVLAIAPLLSMLGDLSFLASLRAAMQAGPVRGKLAEINLVLGIVRIMLIVLAMTFSATPLPFQSVATQSFLVWWWCGVGVLYLLASDFFHVARMIGYLDLWRAFAGESARAG